MKRTINKKVAKEIRERVKELLNTRKVISIKIKARELDFVVHHHIYVMTTNSIDYKLTEYYYQNGKLLSINGKVSIYDIERMKQLFIVKGEKAV